MKYVLLILAGGTGVPAAVFAIARHLVEGHAERHGAAIRAAGDLPSRREVAGHRAADRSKELTR